MKPFLKLSIPLILGILICSVSDGYSVSIIEFPHLQVGRLPVTVNPSSFAGMTITEFLTLTPKKYHSLTDRKLSLGQKFTLKMAQSRVKRMVRKNIPVDLSLIARDVDTSQFDILGFILGLVLGPLGILIAYLLEGRGSSTFTWSIIGGLVWLGLFLLAVLIL